jgi:hypothetical protein
LGVEWFTGSDAFGTGRGYADNPGGEKRQFSTVLTQHSEYRFPRFIDSCRDNSSR